MTDMKNLYRLVLAAVLLFAGTVTLTAYMKRSDTKTDDNGHYLVSLWKDVGKAMSADRPKTALSHLGTIISEAEAGHLPWDYFDAWQQYVDISSSVNWKLRDSLESGMSAALERFGEPVAVFCSEKYAGRYSASADEMLAYVSDNAQRLKAARNRGFYSYANCRVSGSYGSLPSFVTGVIADDYEYALWVMLCRFGGDDPEYGKVRSMLAEYLGESYPSGAYLDFHVLRGGMSGTGDEADYEQFCEDYEGKAISLLARQEILSGRFIGLCEAMSGRKNVPPVYAGMSLSEAFSALRSDCAAFEKLRDSFMAREKAIASSCTYVSGLEETLDSRDISVEYEKDTLKVILRNITEAELSMFPDNGRNIGKSQAAIWTSRVRNPRSSYYVPDTVEVRLPAADDGDYVIQCKAEGVERQCRYSQRSVSVAHRFTGDVCGVYVADFDSGRPLDDVRLAVYDKNVLIYEQNVSCREGFVPLGFDFGAFTRKQLSGLRFMCDYTDADGFRRMSEIVSFDSPSAHGTAEPASVAWTCSMYKDRSAFVPGDTVHFKGVVYASDAGGKGHLMPEGEDVTVVLTDSRGSEAGLITLPVGRYGSFAGQFRIPDGGRNGYYSLKVRYNGSCIPVSGASFRVDDFQLPTFSLEFDRQDMLLVPGCPVEVSGRLTSYTGHSLSKASVEYSVETYAGIVAEGPVDLSDDGRFSFVFTDMNAGNYAYYTVKVKVTDATGETLEFSEFLHVSADAELKVLLENEAEGSVEESREGLYYWRADRNVAILDGDVARCKVIIENSDGEEVAGLKVSYSVMAGGSVIGKGTVLSGESLVADLKGRPSGEYRIEAECPVSFVNAAGADSTVISRHELVILKLDEEDESMSSDVENVFRVADGKDISLVFGAGNGPVWAVVELWDSNLVLRHSEMVYMDGCSGLPGSLRTLKYAFLPEYTDKMLLSVFYFKDGNTYSYSRVYERKADMETMLPLEFTLFPDRTAPGAVCRIGLKTLPDTELLVAVSDKSVEDISPNIWNPLYSRPVPEPYVNISSVTGYVRCRQEYYPDSGMRPALKSNAVYSARTDADDGVMAFNGLPLEESSAASDVAGPAEGAGSPDWPVIRSDFRNTLAFEPFLVTDGEGSAEFSFGTSGKISTYYVYVLAHDRSLKSNVIRREMLVTRDVMVSVVPPQFLYSGDRYVLDASLGNSSSDDIDGVMSFVACDAGSADGDPVLAVSRPVSVQAGKTVRESFEMTVPENVSGIECRVSFSSSQGQMASDAVSVKIRVLPDSQRIEEAHSAVCLPGMDRDSLYNDLLGRFVNVSGYGAEYEEITLNDMLYRAVPSGINVDSRDAVSLADVLYMCGLCSGLREGAVVLKYSEDSDMDAESPVLQELKGCVNPDGGIAWFPGMKSSAPVTAAVLEVFSGLERRGLMRNACAVEGVSPENQTESGVRLIDGIIHGAVAYLDSLAVSADDLMSVGGISFSEYLHVRAGYPGIALNLPDDRKLVSGFRQRVRQCLDVKGREVLQGQILGKARRISVIMSLSDGRAENLARELGLGPAAVRKLMKNAGNELLSLMEYAADHPSGGMYFPNAVMPYRGLLDSELYAHSMICDLLSRYVAASGQSSAGMLHKAASIADGIRIWIMVQKENQSWISDPATVNAVASVVDGMASVGEIRVLALRQGIQRPFRDIKASGNGFRISRTYYVERNGGTEKSVLCEGDSLHVGDKVVAEYAVWSEENRSFVKISAPWNAALRPVDQLSGLRYGLLHSSSSSSVYRAFLPYGYREVKKDRITYYFDVYPEEHTVIREEFFVSRPGIYVSPVVEVESMYATRYRANSGFDGEMTVSGYGLIEKN